MTEEPRRLAEHVDFPVTEDRLERQWSAVEARVAAAGVGARRPARWGRAVAGGLAMAAAIALGIWAFRGALEDPAPGDQVAFDGAQLESGADEVQVALRDGTEIVLDPESGIELARQEPLDVRLNVRRGRARFDVPHVDRRSFVVRSRDVDVVVVGTRFSVAVTGAPGDEHVVVAVEHGAVEVRRAGEPPRRVSTGEELRVSVAPPRPREAADTDGPEAAPDGPQAEAPAPEAPAVEPAPPTPRRPRPDPSELWARATEARRAGEAREAADLYATFLRVAPRDSQAALAAFELGRLRMDRLGDPGGAIAPLRRAIAMAPRAPFAEDAAARLVDATDRAGQGPQCRAARDDYLARYPRGVHRARVEARCD